ncbi:MAG: family N-acetyltransferase [Holophagaceae bacterium]|nr:family N-acetyltransferase [Holophagaceae bacterium]
MRILAFILSGLGILLGLYLLDRAGLWAEQRGWIYWRKKKASGHALGSATLALQDIFESGKARHVIEAKEDAKMEAPDPGSGRPSTLSTATEADLPRLFEVWESAVRATHTFLTEEDIGRLSPLVREGLAAFRPIHCLRDPRGEVFAFLGVFEGRIEMLFVHASRRGQGFGRILVRHAVDTLGATLVDVNEQNDQAIGFYERLGFQTFARSDLDAAGFPFPLLHMRLASPAPSDRTDPGLGGR